MRRGASTFVILAGEGGEGSSNSLISILHVNFLTSLTLACSLDVHLL